MPPPPSITVALGRFDDLFALGLDAALGADPSIAVIARDITAAHLAATLRAHRPQVLIFAVGALPKLADVRTLRLEHPATRLVAFGDTMSVTESAQLLAFGASACLARATQSRDVRNAVHLASRGLQLMPVGAADHDGGGRRETSLLTAREGDVLLLLREGRSNAEIAVTLQIGVETVRTHARSVYRKLGVSSRRTLSRARHA
ncbi:MAG TPA: response regulator transcription factor [Baekduia sp.]|nr:response regulator transcription factor [Baekduia sp.]